MKDVVLSIRFEYGQYEAIILKSAITRDLTAIPLFSYISIISHASSLFVKMQTPIVSYSSEQKLS